MANNGYTRIRTSMVALPLLIAFSEYVNEGTSFVATTASVSEIAGATGWWEVAGDNGT
jgi:hypothetical protein